MGGTLAGYPISLVVHSYSWFAVGVVWVACAVIGALAFGMLYTLPAFGAESSNKQIDKKTK